jgi:putative flippase GtrA
VTTVAPSPTTGARGGPSLNRKLNLYVVVSLVASPANLVLYAVLLQMTSWPPPAANASSAALITTPTFLAYRRFVWGVRTRHSFRREVVPYWLTTGANVGASTLVAWWLGRHDLADGVLVAATFAVYATLWSLRFLLLDRIFSHRRAPGSPDRSPW